jgi:hypothetical protein
MNRGWTWVAEVTEVSVESSYENGEQNVRGVTAKARYNMEYNGIDYSGNPAVKTHACITQFFIPADQDLPQVGDRVVLQAEVILEDILDTLPVVKLPIALENPADTLDEDALNEAAINTSQDS